MAAILTILLGKYQGIEGLIARLGLLLGPIFFFLYYIGIDDITRLLSASPETRGLFKVGFPCAAGLVSYEEREDYVNALGLSQPQEYLRSWSIFLTIWECNQTLLCSSDLARDSELMGLSLSPLVRSVFDEIAQDLESAPVFNAVMAIQLHIKLPEIPLMWKTRWSECALFC